MGDAGDETVQGLILVGLIDLIAAVFLLRHVLHQQGAVLLLVQGEVLIAVLLLLAVLVDDRQHHRALHFAQTVLAADGPNIPKYSQILHKNRVVRLVPGHAGDTAHPFRPGIHHQHLAVLPQQKDAVGIFIDQQVPQPVAGLQLQHLLPDLRGFFLHHLLQPAVPDVVEQHDASGRQQEQGDDDQQLLDAALGGLQIFVHDPALQHRVVFAGVAQLRNAAVQLFIQHGVILTHHDGIFHRAHVVVDHREGIGIPVQILQLIEEALLDGGHSVHAAGNHAVEQLHLVTGHHGILGLQLIELGKGNGAQLKGYGIALFVLILDGDLAGYVIGGDQRNGTGGDHIGQPCTLGADGAGQNAQYRVYLAGEQSIGGIAAGGVGDILYIQPLLFRHQLQNVDVQSLGGVAVPEVIGRTFALDGHANVHMNGRGMYRQQDQKTQNGQQRGGKFDDPIFHR